MNSLYEIKAVNMEGEEILLEKYKNKVLLIVNTASKCGFTGQFSDLEELYMNYKAKGFEVLGFPCNQFKDQDPGTNEEILNFCQMNYGVTFDMFQKIDVKGENIHPLYSYLIENTANYKGEDIHWNFEKFLIDRNGKIVKRYLSVTNPLKISKEIEKFIE